MPNTLSMQAATVIQIPTIQVSHMEITIARGSPLVHKVKMMPDRTYIKLATPADNKTVYP